MINMEKRLKVLETAKLNILKAQERQKLAYDRKRSRPETFELDALVLKKDFNKKKRRGGKLDGDWIGPYKIAASLGRGLYCLKDTKDPQKKISRVCGVHLKPYHKDPCGVSSQIIV